jgi:protein TonB
MFERLTASSHRIRSRPAALVAAVGAHAALGLLLVRSTGSAMTPPRPIDVTIFDPFVPPRPVAHPTSRPSGGPSGPPTGEVPTPAPAVPTLGPAGVPDVLPAPTLADHAVALDALRDGAIGEGARVPGDGVVAASETLELEPPRLRAMPEPRYPDALRAVGVEGRVELEFVVDAAGRVDSTSVVVRSAPAAAFAAAAREAIAAARFEPARLRGAPVAARARQAVVFRITGTR